MRQSCWRRMRIGSNPLHDKRITELKPVVLAVITHLPEQKGYHADRLEVVQTCIRSMIKDNEDCSLVIWDNGSCSALRNWLRLQKPDIFIESRNVGKTSARTSIFRMFPPETIICMSDDDILYYPGWLEAQMQILTTYPNVSCVSGNPIRTSFRWGCENTIKWMKEHDILEVGRFIPEQYERDFCVSIGREYEWHKKYTENDVDYRGRSLNGVYAYATSHHCQFIARAGVADIMQFDDHAMGDEKPFDVAMDKIGLRLSTVKRNTRHIGNVIHPELRQEIEVLNLC